MVHLWAISLRLFKCNTREVSECPGFLMQCQLYFEVLPQQFPSDRTKIAFILSLLAGDAPHWAETLYTSESPALKSLETFMAHFKAVFGASTSALTVHKMSALSKSTPFVPYDGIWPCTMTPLGWKCSRRKPNMSRSIWPWLLYCRKLDLSSQTSPV